MGAPRDTTSCTACCVFPRSTKASLLCPLGARNKPPVFGEVKLQLPTDIPEKSY